MNRKKDAPIEDWDALDDLMGAMREKRAERDKRVARRDAEVAEVAARHSPKIDDLNAQISTMEATAMAFLEQRRAEFGEPGGKAPRFRDLLHGRVGARQVPPKVVTVRDLTFDDVVEYLAASKRASLKKFLKVTTSLDRAKVISEMDEATLEDVGLQIVREDRLYVDLKEA